MCYHPHIYPPSGFFRTNSVAIAPRASSKAANSGSPDGRSAAAPGESLPVGEVTDIEQLERHLLRQGLDGLSADRSNCVDCGRTPLIGELVHVYGGRRGGIVCELCRTGRREPPAATEVVRHSEHGQTVRLTVRAA